VLGVSFDAPDTLARGYTTERARLGTEQNPQWLWISPNTVPRGFVRKNDQRYSELKDLMPGFAERFPELPPGSYILNAEDGVRAKAIEACEKIGCLSARYVSTWRASNQRLKLTGAAILVSRV
jgi:hypothetical protein